MAQMGLNNVMQGSIIKWTRLLIGSHVEISAVGVLWGVLWNSGRPMPLQAPANSKLTGETPLESRALEAINAQYARCTVPRELYSRDVVFEDPFAICEGIEEVTEAFRALKAIQPRHLGLSVANVDQVNRCVEVDIWQQYRIGVEFTLHSRVVVWQDEDDAITRVEERWKTNKPISFPPFSWSRWINGKVSYAVTQALV